MGGSFGGMQVFVWSLMYLECVVYCIDIVLMLKLFVQNIVFNEVVCLVILFDFDFYGGDYYVYGVKLKCGLCVVWMIGYIMYLFDDDMVEKFGWVLCCVDGVFDVYNFSFDVEFEVELYLCYQGDKFVDYFDVNIYLLIMCVFDYFDLVKVFDGNLMVVFVYMQVKYLIVSFLIDWCFVFVCLCEIVKVLFDNKCMVSYVEIDVLYGYDVFLFDDVCYYNLICVYYE